MENKKAELKREVGIRGVAACVLNNSIGSGIFILPAIVAATLGSSSIFAYLLCGMAILFIILCFTEVGSQFDISGGAYTYIENAFGKFPGFLASTVYTFGYSITSDAAIANALADTLSPTFPALILPVNRAILIMFLLLFLTLVNYRGVKYGIWLVELSTYTKLIPLIIIILFGFSHIRHDNLIIHNFPGFKDIGEVSLVLFFAFIGAENALSNSGEIKNPGKTIPFGMIGGILLLIVIYLLIQIVAQGVLGIRLADFKEAPLAEIARTIIGPAGLFIVIAGASVSMFGTISGDVLGGPRVLYAAARDGILPQILSKVHHRFSTPHWAIIVYSVLIFIFSVSGGFRILATLSSAAILLIYLGVILAMIKLRCRKSNLHVPKFRVPLGLTIPGIAIITIIWLLSNLALNEALGLLFFISLMSLIYFIRFLLRKRKKSIVDIKAND